jgi:hypothetical protein
VFYLDLYFVSTTRPAVAFRIYWNAEEVWRAKLSNAEGVLEELLSNAEEEPEEPLLNT